MNDESRLSAAPADPSRSTRESNAWPRNLTTPQLTALSGQLDTAITRLNHVNEKAILNGKLGTTDPVPRREVIDDLIHAAAIARIELRRRTTRVLVDEAWQALRESGWKPGWGTRS